MSYTIAAESANIEPVNSKSVNVELIGVDSDDLLDHITIQEAIDYFQEDEILDKIGEDKVMEYFGLVKPGK